MDEKARQKAEKPQEIRRHGKAERTHGARQDQLRHLVHTRGNLATELHHRHWGLRLANMTALAIWVMGATSLFCTLWNDHRVRRRRRFPCFSVQLPLRLRRCFCFSVPDTRFLSFSIAPSFAAPFAIAGLASGSTAIGVLTTCQPMNDASWRALTWATLSAGGRADGLGSGNERKPQPRQRGEDHRRR
jgi:hypothetical protein